MERINSTHFGLAQHRYNTFSATVPPETTPEELTSSSYWENVISACRPGDEIRVRAADDSFLILLYVMHVAGTESIIRLVYNARFETADVQALDDNSPYFFQLCGELKYCIIKRETGERVIENIPTKAEAAKELEQYMKALAA